MGPFKQKIQARYTVVELNPEFFARAVQQGLMSSETKEFVKIVDTMTRTLKDERALNRLLEQSVPLVPETKKPS